MPWEVASFLHRLRREGCSGWEGQPAASSGDRRERRGAARLERPSTSSHSTNATGGRWLGLEATSVLWYRGGQQAPALESRVLGLDAGPKELLCCCFAIVLGQVATKVCWQDVSVDLLVEGLQLLAVHKDLEGDGSDPQQRARAALPDGCFSQGHAFACRPLSHTHPLQQFALQEWFDHVVGGGEVPRLVDEVDSLEPCWEGVLESQTQTQMVTRI